MCARGHLRATILYWNIFGVIFYRFHITEETWQYTVGVEGCKYINRTEDDIVTDSNNSTMSNDATTNSNNKNGNNTRSEPIPACPLIFAVRSRGLADVGSYSYVKDCSEVSKFISFLI